MAILGWKFDPDLIAVIMEDTTTPTTPESGNGIWFVDAADGLMKYIDSAGVVYKLTAGSLLGSITFVVGSEAGDVINVALQFKDVEAADMAVRIGVFAYLSDDANGDSIAATAPDGGIAIGTDGLAIPVVADKAWQLTSEVDGDLDIDITESGIDTWYLIVRMPDGSLLASTAITFA